MREKDIHSQTMTRYKHVSTQQRFSILYPHTFQHHLPHMYLQVANIQPGRPPMLRTTIDLMFTPTHAEDNTRPRRQECSGQ
jgi:hypothetical protein